jgi:NADH:ubiquinone oxidoreductase subunit K
MGDIGLGHFLVVSSLVFGLGAAIVMVRRNAVAVLMGVELILNAAALNFVAFGRYIDTAEAGAAHGAAIAGQAVALFIVVAAAAEAAVALAIVLNFFNRYQTIHLDEASELQQ